MKKNILLLSLLFLPIVLFSQNKTIEINWENSEKSNQEAFSAEYKSSKSNKKSATGLLDLLIDQEMYFIEQWNDTRFAEAESLEISNIVYGSLTASEINKIDKSLIAEQHSYFLGSGKARAVYYTSVSINPIVRINGVYKKVLSFTISYRYKNYDRAVHKECLLQIQF